MRRVTYLKTGEDMWWFGTINGLNMIGFEAYAAILASDDQIKFFNEQI